MATTKEPIAEPVTETAITERNVWKQLEDRGQKAGPAHLRDLFANDSERGVRFAVETGETMKVLLQPPEES